MKLPPQVTERAFTRLAEIGAASNNKVLRIAVEGGGCSGFQYAITLDKMTQDDFVISKDGESVVIDSVSLPFLNNAKIDFEKSLIGERFVIQNPNAVSSCGCGISFSL